MSKLRLTEREIAVISWVEWGALSNAHALLPDREPLRTACGSRVPRLHQKERLAPRRCDQCTATLAKALAKSGPPTCEAHVTDEPVYSLSLTGSDERGYSIVRNGVEIARVLPKSGFNPELPHMVKLFRDRWALLDGAFNPVVAGDYLPGTSPWPWPPVAGT